MVWNPVHHRVSPWKNILPLRNLVDFLSIKWPWTIFSGPSALVERELKLGKFHTVVISIYYCTKLVEFRMKVSAFTDKSSISWNHTPAANILQMIMKYRSVEEKTREYTSQRNWATRTNVWWFPVWWTMNKLRLILKRTCKHRQAWLPWTNWLSRPLAESPPLPQSHTHHFYVQ